MAVCTGVVLAFFSLGLHECAVSADEAEMRVACRAMCELSTAPLRQGAVGGQLGEIASRFRGIACSAMSDEAPQLLHCRDILKTRSMSVADYHCLRDAEHLAEARACDVLQD